MDDLNAILNSVWSQLFLAAGNPGAEWGLASLATIGDDGSPRQRTVVLRAVDRERHLLYCYTDSRAAKATEVRENERVTWLFYNRQQRVQVVMSGSAVVRATDDFVLQAWMDLPAESRRIYASRNAPGTPLVHEDAGAHNKGNGGQTLPQTDAEPTRYHFAVITARIDFIDWLRLLPEGNIRAQFRWTDEFWQMTWVTP